MALAKSLAISLYSNIHSTSPFNKQTSLFHSCFNNLHLYNASFYGQLRAIESKTKRPTLLCSSVALENQVPIKEDKMEELVGGIRERLESVTLDHETLEFLDLIERLGIARFFDEQIRRIIKNIFMQWNKKFGLGSAESTVLAFRLLRLHGYPVDTCVLEHLRGENGEFSSFSINTPAKISAMLNLHRCWQVCFHTESKIAEEIRKFTTSQLNLALSDGDQSRLQANNLKSEIMFALEYPRRYLVQRIESRSIIRQLWPSTGYKRMGLELAKLDLAMLQSVHKQETDALEKWWEESGIPAVTWARSGVLKSYFAMSVLVYEPEFAAFRVAFTKNACLAALVDDLFDLPSLGSDGLARFTDAFLRWDDSSLHDLPEHKIIFNFLQRTVVELAAEASQAQGRDLFPFMKSLWDDALKAFIKEGEWRNARHVPSWDEYVSAATLTVSGVTCMWTSVFSMGEQLSDEALRLVGPGSRFMDLIVLVARLSNDLATFEREARDGEVASSVSAYMLKNPDCKTVEEAVAALQKLGDSWCHELETELFQVRKVVPECVYRAVLGFARTMAFLYKRADAFTDVCDEVYEDLVKDYMSGSIQA
ncbi:hypothetical protein LUZ60_015947 [Juncus effusus]|nr:hypothetical protein LUZ60_015947 [Juncus effusus]